MPAPRSSKELIEQYSQAKVVQASSKPFITGTDPLTGLPTFSREITKEDVLKQLQRLR